MECPTCEETRVTGHGRQKVAITEQWDEEEVHDWDVRDWFDKYGTWTWACRACGHTWTTDED